MYWRIPKCFAREEKNYLSRNSRCLVFKFLNHAVYTAISQRVCQRDDGFLKGFLVTMQTCTTVLHAEERLHYAHVYALWVDHFCYCLPNSVVYWGCLYGFVYSSTSAQQGTDCRFMALRLPLGMTPWRCLQACTSLLLLPFSDHHHEKLIGTFISSVDPYSHMYIVRSIFQLFLTVNFCATVTQENVVFLQKSFQK